MILIAVISLGAIGAIGAVFLYAASKKFEVYEDPRIAEVQEALPGANCGGCGYPGVVREGCFWHADKEGGLHSVAVEPALSRRYGVPVVLENDVNAALAIDALMSPANSASSCGRDLRSASFLAPSAS